MDSVIRIKVFRPDQVPTLTEKKAITTKIPESGPKTLLISVDVTDFICWFFLNLI